MDKETFNHYMVGIDSIDSQHWDLMESLNQFKSVAAIAGIELSNILLNIKAKLIVHFAFEEALFLEYDFPFREYHIETHRILLIELEKSILLKPELYIVQVILEKLNSIIITHIDTLDIQFGEFVKNKEMEKNTK